MQTKLKQRQRLILEAFLYCGGKTATTAQIAAKAKLSVNGVAQTLGALDAFVKMGAPVNGGNQRWLLIMKPPPLSKPLWAKLNERRAQLIDKHLAQTITPEEQIELRDLQDTAMRQSGREETLGPLIRKIRKIGKDLEASRSMS